ncbi:hypothetical protein SLS55_002799 [Diplodia seriata]|uniref:Uncharacterized protein n=1 Tax=Diplodia seriata TaxID=420778 RepID=A0ABR3CPI1_9PEZI
MVSHQNTLHSYFSSSLHAPLSPTLPHPHHPHSSGADNMSTTPASEPERKPRQSSVLSVSTQGGDEKSRNARKGSRAKHSWEYVAVDPTEDEAPPPTASRLQKELYSSFTNNFLAGQGRRTRAAAVHASQHFHDHSGSELSNSSHSHPGSESAFSTTTSNTHASPASSPAPPSALSASRKRKDSAAPTSDSTRKKAKVSTPAPPVTSDPTSSGATAAQTAPATAEAAAPATAPASSPAPHPAPAVQPAHPVHQDESSVSTTSRAPEGQAKEPAKRKSTVFDDATNKTKASKKADAKPSPAPDPSENRKRKSSPPPVEKMAPKAKKAKTSTATTDAAAKSAKAAAAQKRDSLLQGDVYAQQQTPPWTNTATQQNYASHHANQQLTHSKATSKQQQAQQRFAYHPPTRAQLADQLEEITHRGIAGGPANYPSIREYRAACAAEAAWQERDQEVVERMLDNPRVIEVLKRLRELNEEIEAERKGSKSAAKGHGKGGRKRKVTDDLMDGD